MVSFDLRERRFAAERPAGVAATFDGGGPWYEVSRDGERPGRAGLGRTPPPPALYVDIAEGLWRGTPAGLSFNYFSLNGLSDDARPQRGARQRLRRRLRRFVGRPSLPDAGYGESAAVLSPDGRRLYVYSLPRRLERRRLDRPAAHLRLRRHGIGAREGTAPTGKLPLLGRRRPARVRDLPPADARRRMRPADDERLRRRRTLFVAGSARLLVIPVAVRRRGGPAGHGRRRSVALRAGALAPAAAGAVARRPAAPRPPAPARRPPGRPPSVDRRRPRRLPSPAR